MTYDPMKDPLKVFNGIMYAVEKHQGIDPDFVAGIAAIRGKLTPVNDNGLYEIRLSRYGYSDGDMNGGLWKYEVNFISPKAENFSHEKCTGFETMDEAYRAAIASAQKHMEKADVGTQA